MKQYKGQRRALETCLVHQLLALLSHVILCRHDETMDWISCIRVAL